MTEVFWLATLAVVVIGVAVLIRWLKKSAPAGEELARIMNPPTHFVPTHICGNCRSRIRPVESERGSGVIEVLLWLFLIVPGIIYTIWRTSTRGLRCPICAAPHPIPLGTPAAEALAIR